MLLSDSAIESIGEDLARNLKHLKFSGYYPLVTSQGMLLLAKLHNLESLDVSNNPAVKDPFLLQISASCKELTVLNVSGIIIVF